MSAITPRPDRSIDDLDAAARRRLIDAIDEVRIAAKAYGLHPASIGELYAPLPMRCEAWLCRVERERCSWQAILAAPLFAGCWKVAA